jgi:thiamine biosynthesis protein ThiS
VTINGEAHTFPLALTIEELLRSLEIPMAAVAVEVNRTVISKRTHATHRIRHGDEVEIVTFVGGG